jgi:hypothetical protein
MRRWNKIHSTFREVCRTQIQFRTGGRNSGAASAFEIPSVEAGLVEGSVEYVGKAYRQIPPKSLIRELIELETPKTSAQNCRTGVETQAVLLRFKEEELHVTKTSKKIETTTYFLTL